MEPKMTQPNQPQTSQEQGPREFWLREEYKNDKYEFFSCEIATRKPDTEKHSESDFKDSLHVIEYSAYQSLQQKVSELEAENKRYREALEFYADKDNWTECTSKTASHMIGPGDHVAITPFGLKYKAGFHAIRALKGEEK